MGLHCPSSFPLVGARWGRHKLQRSRLAEYRAFTRFARPSILIAPWTDGLRGLNWVELIVNGACRARHIVDLIHFNKERETSHHGA